MQVIKASPSSLTEKRGLGWDVDSPFSRPRGKGYPVGSFGHTGEHHPQPGREVGSLVSIEGRRRQIDQQPDAPNLTDLLGCQTLSDQGGGREPGIRRGEPMGERQGQSWNEQQVAQSSGLTAKNRVRLPTPGLGDGVNQAEESLTRQMKVPKEPHIAERAQCSHQPAPAPSLRERRQTQQGK